VGEEHNHRRILYSMVYDMREQENITFKTENGIAILCPETPLWIMLAQGKTMAEAQLFFRAAMPHFGAPLIGLVAERETAITCADIYLAEKKSARCRQKEIVSRYLPPETALQLCRAPGEIRPANTPDMPVILEWLNNFYEETLGISCPKKAFGANPNPPREKRFSFANLFVLHDKKPVAMGMLTGAGKTARMNLIYVPPAERGKGYGKTIVSGLAARVREAKQMPVLYAERDNIAAAGLYEGLGFCEAGKLTEFRFS